MRIRINERENGGIVYVFFKSFIAIKFNVIFLHLFYVNNVNV